MFNFVKFKKKVSLQLRAKKGQRDGWPLADNKLRT